MSKIRNMTLETLETLFFFIFVRRAQSPINLIGACRIAGRGARASRRGTRPRRTRPPLRVSKGHEKSEPSGGCRQTRPI
eukprot:1950969-Prymnesium_polylepis.1